MKKEKEDCEHDWKKWQVKEKIETVAAKFVERERFCKKCNYKEVKRKIL